MSSAGKTDQEIANTLGLSKDTVNSYWKRILPKMGAASRTAAVATYWRTGGPPDKSLAVVNVSTEPAAGPVGIPFGAFADCLNNIRAFSSFVLAALIQTSQAEFGFVGSVRRDEQGAPYLKEHAITDISWDDFSRDLFNQSFANGMEFRNLQTLFGEVMRTESLVISNSPHQDTRAGGLPPGHPPLNTFMGLPIHYRHEFVGMACLGNRPGGFEPALASELAAILDAYGSALYFHKESMATTESLHRTDLCSRLMAAALEDSQTGVLIESESGTILFANEPFCKLFNLSIPPECLYGLQCSDLLGRNIHQFEDPEATIAFVSHCLAENPNKAETTLSLRGQKPCRLKYTYLSGNDDAGHCWTYSF